MNLQQRLENFYQVSAEEQQNTLRTILSIANSDPQKFRSAVHATGFDGITPLPVIYEALSIDLVNWSDFFIEECKRILGEARKVKNPSSVLSHLTEFDFIDPEKFTSSDVLIGILKKELTNSNPTFRFHAITSLIHFVRPDDFETIAQLKELLQDEDWRIRYITFLELKSINHIGDFERLSLLDRIRGKCLGYPSFD